MSLFKAKGDVAQWRTLYDYLSTLRIDDVVKDEELVALLPDAAPGSVFGAFHRAVKQCEDDMRRTFTRVRGVGYRMVHARENEALARAQHKKAGRRMTAATRKAHSADRSLLSREERQRLDALEMNLAQQAEMIKRLDKGLKVERQERKAENADLAERVDRLAELLQRHGINETSPVTS